jgi:hypothetical protein
MLLLASVHSQSPHTEGGRANSYCTASFRSISVVSGTVSTLAEHSWIHFITSKKNVLYKFANREDVKESKEEE